MKLRLAADENFRGAIVRGLLRRRPDLDLVRVQDVGLTGAGDPEVLAWAAREQRLLLTHDLSTLPSLVYERVTAGLAMPGVCEVDPGIPTAVAIEEILLVVDCSLDREWEGRIVYLPLHG
jgi:Domain of unknown function (DUF5615)